MTPVRRIRLAVGFARLRPWVTQFQIEGRRFGGAISLVGDTRVAHFAAAFPDASRILELGSLEGGQTFQLARLFPNASILAVEGRASNLRKARFVQRQLGIDNVEFRQVNLERVALSSLGRFDAVFCSGLLYHLPRPWELIDGLRAATGNVYISTHYATSDRADAEVDGIPGLWYQEFGPSDPLSGLSPRSFWMTVPALVARLEQNDFGVEIVSDDPGHINGPLVGLVARTRTG